ncbi:MAG: AMP-binding protein [Pseudomonadota bacterium]
MHSVYDAFTKNAIAHTGRPFLHIPAVATKAYSGGAIDLTYGDAAQAIDTTLSRYQEAGYGNGHRVAVLLENRREFFIHWFALNALGVSIVPVNGEMSEDDVAYILGHSEVCLAVSVHEKCQLLKDAAAHAGIDLPVIEHSLSALPAACSSHGNEAIGPHTEAAILYTSGSTGKPKGCVLSNEYFLLGGQRYINLGGLCTLQPGIERLLTPLPLVHMNAMAASTMAMVLSGGCIVQLDRFHPTSWWQTVVESGATIVHYLGVMPAMLLNLDTSAFESDHRVKFGFGAGVNPIHHERFEQRFNIPLIEAWAMTESGNANSVVANQEPRHVGTSCFGKPPDDIDVVLVDELGHEVPEGEQGELLLRARGDDPRRGFFSRYLKNEEATREAWQGGWLHTGDVVRFGQDGQLHFVDRRKNVIRRSGENISALEVEAIASTHAAIEQVAVAPVPDEIRGDEVMACIVPRPGQASNLETAQSVFNHCRGSLTYFKLPGYIAFVDALPLTASNKPRRDEIKKLCRRLLQEHACYDLTAQKRKS